VLRQWLIAVNIAQRCSNTRTDPQNADATLFGNFHDLCAITELEQRELPTATSHQFGLIEAHR